MRLTKAKNSNKHTIVATNKKKNATYSNYKNLIIKILQTVAALILFVDKNLKTFKLSNNAQQKMEQIQFLATLVLPLFYISLQLKLL